MGMTQSSKELLAGHKSRMKVMNISKFITEYKPTDKVKQMVPDKEIIDNFVMMVMVYIMEHTLSNDRKCTLSMIASFLEEVSEPFSDYCQIDDYDELARFIVVGILQNNGKLANFSVYDPEKEKITYTTIRLLNEEAGAYSMTTDGCDYLFRTHELAVDVQYSVAKYILKEHLKRENYSEALDQSKELISTLRNIYNMLCEFSRKCRENIYNVTIDEYTKMMERFYSVIAGGFGELQNMQQSADEKAKELRQAIEVNLDLETKKHVTALEGISNNIKIAIHEMRRLSKKCDECKVLYKDDIYSGFTANFYDRLDLHNDIMKPLEKGDLSIDILYQFFRYPLRSPEIESVLNPESLYSVEEMYQETPDSDGEDIETVAEDTSIAEIRNKRFRGITKEFFAYMKSRDNFRFSEFVNAISHDNLQWFCDERSLPQVFMSLYSLGDVSISGWKAEAMPDIPPTGEFDLAVFLKDVPAEMLEMDGFTVIKTNDDFTFSTDNETITTNDFTVEVRKA